MTTWMNYKIIMLGETSQPKYKAHSPPSHRRTSAPFSGLPLPPLGPILIKFQEGQTKLQRSKAGKWVPGAVGGGGGITKEQETAFAGDVLIILMVAVIS